MPGIGNTATFAPGRWGMQADVSVGVAAEAVEAQPKATTAVTIPSAPRRRLNIAIANVLSTRYLSR